MRKSVVEHTFVEVGDQKIPAKIYREIRRSVRFSIAKKGAILRMPIVMLPHEQDREVASFKSWVAKQIIAKQSLQEHFTPKNYKTGDNLTVGERVYRLVVEMTNHKTHSAMLKNGSIFLRLTSADEELSRLKATKHLLSRVVAQDFLPEITQRVLELNQRHFQKNIRSVNLKYNLSNWGSCSSKGNINLSTRLLFAPQDVMDYVIVHELAHLVEMNHSFKFWNVVSQVMPDYTEKENWLKKNWQLCDF